MQHLRKFAVQYVLAFVTAFTTVWVANPGLQAMLPPKAVSVIAGLVAGASLLKLTIAGMRVPPQ